MSCSNSKMNPSFLFFLFLFSPLALSIADDPPIKPGEYQKMDCVPKSCGHVENISYPFWVDGQQPSHCGFPSFKLSCTNQTLVLKVTAADSYIVREIFYENQSIALANAAFVNTTCPVLNDWNVSFALTPFAISSANRVLLILFDCSAKPNYYKIPCDYGDPDNEAFAYLGGDYYHVGSVGNCKSAAVQPVVDYSGDASTKDFARLLSNGFLVNWTASSCDACRASKGQCGYNSEIDNFMCACPDRTHYKSCDATDADASKTKPTHRKSTIIIVIGAGAGGALILGCCIFLLYNRRKKQRQASLSNLLSRSTSSKISSKKDPELGDTSYHTHIFSYDELEEATNGFNVSRELGDGGFGTVYKGKLRDGRTVAVKRLYENNYRRLEQFMNEVKILSSLRHQNLVTLYGCTSRHSRELLLVYEYIPNGTLADHLHGHLASDGALPWPVRMSIAIETADALAYLHAVEPQIIHRDVKTNNILLDNSFHVKVADFGLSRLFPLDATHVSTAPQGTPGYVDPEYHQCYQLTDKSDVYSFGVVLVELISSKPAVDISRHRHEINLSNMAITKIQNCQIDQLVDPGLGYQSRPEIMGMINQVAELAFRCLQSDREMRPCIKEVLEVLKTLEGGGNKAEKEAEVAEVQMKEETRLLKTVSPFSPDSVTERWSSRLTTPNTST